MKERIINENDLENMLSRKEWHFYDNKAIQIGWEKIQKICVAFANADGWEFIVWIRDESELWERLEGSTEMESYNEVLQNIQSISPSIPHDIEFLKFGSNYLLRVTVEKSDKVHKTSAWKVYVRKWAQSLPITDPEKILALSYSKGESSYEDTIVKDATAEDIFESKEISVFLSHYSPQSDSIDYTINQNLVDRTTYEPRTAGILLFNDNPVPLLPKRCWIKISRYDTSEEIPEREHLKEQLTIEGCLNEQINESSSNIQRIMESVQIMWIKGLTHANYPPETIWEILVNAVIHRDYSISDDIHILIYNNRIEIKSPWRLPWYVTIENILDARFSRNSKIVRTLNKYPNPPNKDMGEWLNTAFQKMEEFRLSNPVISEEWNYVKVTIPHTPLASPEERVISYLRNNPQIRNKTARELTWIKSENVMKEHFYTLRDKWLIIPVRSTSVAKKVIAWKLAESNNEV